MSVRAPMCMFCKHFHYDKMEGPLTCDAFPDRIPLEILEHDVLHYEPFEGDGGIQFEQRADMPEYDPEPE